MAGGPIMSHAVSQGWRTVRDGASRVFFELSQSSARTLCVVEWAIRELESNLGGHCLGCAVAGIGLSPSWHLLSASPNGTSGVSTLGIAELDANPTCQRFGYRIARREPRWCWG